MRTSALLLALMLGVPQAAHGQETAIGGHLLSIDQLLADAYRESKAAETANTVELIKQHADAVFAMVWGQSSGLLGASGGAAQMHGWKTRWQTTGEEFDENHVARHGNLPPVIDNPALLGIMGRGRAAVALMLERSDEPHMEHVIVSLSNVIGWMRLDDGVTKGERQPRIDLTHVWDAPSRFWNTTADTGWLNEVFAQATNLIKTNYGANVGLAQSHAQAMTALIERCRAGMDEDGDGTVAPVMMEGGLDTALEHARYGGLIE
ncbi:MAG: hypothetical protein OXU68_13800 [Bacteroidota bacterium]|nr:hypothetical protein [Bacteroidota bacterium]